MGRSKTTKSSRPPTRKVSPWCSQACATFGIRARLFFIESKSRSKFLFCRILGGKTGIHFSLKCSWLLHAAQQ
ncbi:MAG: hypothetical protein EXQ84_00960 [Rhodospirillaceae bacterium]|nr:hypothetical protein [Rhodospirillaceae bacterium]